MATKSTGKALRGRCTVRFQQSRTTLDGIAASLLDDLSGKSDSYTIDVLLTAERQRVTYGVDTKNPVTAVFLRSGGMVIWDSATRTFAKIDVGLPPKTRVEAAGRLDTSTREHGDETLITLNVEDASMGAIRHELTVSRRPDLAPFGPALLRVLHCGPSCHAQTGVPWQSIASAGLIIRERTFAGKGNDLISDLDIDSIEIVDAPDSEFDAPGGYVPLEDAVKKGGEPRPVPSDEDAPQPEDIQKAVIKQALEDTSGGVRRALRIKEKLTPDCLGSTRFGSMTASLHQDFLSVASNTINLVAPLLGPTTIAAGTWTIPWLTNLAGAVAAAPGSGLFSLLRVPRTVSMPPGTAGGGIGLLDRLAFRSLYELDAAGLMRTQRDFAAGTLPATLAGWGAGPPADANLIAAGGDLRLVSPVDQRSLVETYEVAELGTIRISGLPGTPGPPGAPGVIAPFSFGSITVGPVVTPPMFTITVTGVGGTVNFASLGAGPLVTAATIGGAGNIVVGLSLPTITLTATVTATTSWFGGLVVGLGTVAFCFMFPFFCPFIVVLATLAAFVMNNITVVTATLTGVTWTLDVRFDFDPATERVEPFVTLLSRTGVVAVGTFGPTPNIIGNAIMSLTAAFANMFDLWGVLLAAAGVPAIQAELRKQGLQLPVAGRQNELRAIGGLAESSAGSLLQLSADVRPIDEVATQPFTTQVATSEQMRNQLKLAHLNIRRDLNPQPVPAPPGPGPAITVGTFAGLGLSQNALNYYLFKQWVAGRFEVTVTDPVLIAKVIALAPQLFVRQPVRIHMWPAAPPRVEIAPSEIVRGTRPLVVFFDDVRACFEVPNSQGSDGMGGVAGLWEISCNFKTQGTVEMAWPWVFGMKVDPARPPASDYEPRTWEFIDPNAPAIMSVVQPQNLAQIVAFIAAMITAPISTAGIQNATAVPPWTRPLPAMQQFVFPPVQPPAGLRPQQVYLEMLARRKALYLLPAIDTTLLELIDGSGAPVMNTILLPLAGAPGPFPVTLRTMRRAQGAALRDFLLPLIGLPAGP